jgi:cold shock CspA family protein
LQDRLRRTQGEVKRHEHAPAATVARLDSFGEFGFLETDRGRAIYFHRSVLGSTYSSLAVGSRVTFAEEAGEKGAQATTEGGAATTSSEPVRRPRRSPKTGSHFLARINAPCLRMTGTAASASPANSQGRIALSDTKWSLTSIVP